MAPQLVIVGHIVKDTQPEGWRPGGGALYAAAQAAALGIQTGVVTACEPGLEPDRLLPGVDWHVLPVSEGIRFDNTYTMGQRSQRVLSTSTPITFDDIPPAWRDAPMLLLTPVFHDIDPSLPRLLVNSNTILGIAAQGWLRRLDGDRVLPGEVEPASEWLHGDVLFLSSEDVTDPEAVNRWQEHAGTIVLTRGREGYVVWDAGSRHDLPSLPACEKDPTGAGDVFAAAYMVRYSETADALQSARFAAAAAAASVEGEGIEAIAGREQIEARLVAAGVTG